MTRDVTYKNVEETHLPILKEMLHNGRMNSIACSRIKEQADIVNEAELINCIINDFVDADGLIKLVSEELQQVMGACAFATILFQKRASKNVNLVAGVRCCAPNIPRDTADCSIGILEKKANSMVSTSLSVTQYLMEVLDLIKPRKGMQWEDNGKLLDSSFVLTVPHELVTLQLVGMDLKKVLAMTTFGYKSLTTHVIKRALAATSVVELETRPPFMMPFVVNKS